MPRKPVFRKPKRLLRDQRKQLVDRYFRFTVTRAARRFGRTVARMWSRRRLRASEKKRQKALDATLNVVAVELARAKRLGLESSSKVLNLALFYLIAERDIQSVKLDALTHRDPWRRSLAARVLMLTIHEMDIDKAAGREFNDILRTKELPDALLDEVRDVMRSIRRAQSRAKARFAHLRHSTIAHRDPDALLQYRDILHIDGLDVVSSTLDFYAEASRFIDMLPRLMAHLATLPQVLSQMIDSGQLGDRQV